MSNPRRPRMFRRSRAEPVPDAVSAALTESFLDMDKRQSVAEAAVAASEQLFPEQRMRALWDPVVQGCYAASAAYLAMGQRDGDQGGGALGSGPVGSGPVGSGPVGSGPVSSEAVGRQLVAASRAVDEFYGANRTHLEHAHAVMSAIPGEAARAAATATAARQRLAGAAKQFTGYPSVRAGEEALSAAVARLDSALAGGGAKPLREAAAGVDAAAAALDLALANAPKQQGMATQTLAAVSTRMAAAATRIEGLAPAFSSLLREFSTDCSADLVGNERDSRLFMEAAAADLAAARSALAQGDPERAAQLGAEVRGQVAKAEDQADAVTDRLALLRAVRANPRAKEEQVRFRLHDAQMLAVSRGVVGEWGSVLDAQVDRVDRIAGQLTGRHPDYWRYVSELDAVATFVSGVVERMRKSAPGAGTR